MKRGQRGLWPPWHVAVQCGGLLAVSLLVGTGLECCRPPQQPGTSISAQPCPDPLLVFVWLQAFVNQILFHTQHQLKGNGVKPKFECRSKALFKELFQSGNSGITCFVASLDLPVSFCPPKYFILFLCVIVFPLFIKCRLFPGPRPLTPAGHSSVLAFPSSTDRASLRAALQS